MIFQTDKLEFYSSQLRNISARSHPRTGMKPAHKSLLLWHLLVAVCYTCGYRTEGALRGQRLVDLTHTFDNETIYWITEPTLKLDVTYNGTRPGTDFWYQKDEFSAATHGGTHLDAPSHFARGRWSVSDIPIDRLVAPAVVIDISRLVDDDPARHFSLDHLHQWESEHGRIPDGSLMLVRTGWSRFWPDRLKYSGTDDRDASRLRFPSIEKEVADWLVGNRDVVGIGIDTMSIDIPNTRPAVHVTLMERNIYALENVNNLDLLPPTGALVYVMPMKLRYASGAPCRIVAQLPSEGSSGLRVGVDKIVTFMCVIAVFVIAGM